MSNSTIDDEGDAGDPASHGPYFTTKVMETLPTNLFGEDDEAFVDPVDDGSGDGLCGLPPYEDDS